MLTVQNYPIAASATRLCASSTDPRNVVVLNDGLCSVWLGTSSVTAGAGRRIDPGDVATYTGGDELYAAAWGSPVGSVTVDQQ
jgi:hypothetical protein